MPPLQTYGKRPVVVLTNDDGPPSDSSPNVYDFAKALKQRLDWEVKVVIPDCQKSWVGKAYAISDVIKLSYFYPLEPDGRQGEITSVSRPLKEGETMEWILLSGTPASCANIALHNLYPGQIDLIISGPNHGRNSSTAFALSSGTIGAALAGTLSIPVPGPSGQPSLHETHMPSIAVSYGVVERPVPAGINELATEAAVDVCGRLFNDWGYEDGPQASPRRPVQLYTVNVPLVKEYLLPENRKVSWATLWRSAYGRLFKLTDGGSAKWDPSDRTEQKPNVPQASKPDDWDQGTAGPGALPTPPSSATPTTTDQLKFQFSPNIQPILFPPPETLPYGTDAWAFAQGYISVVPLRAEFAGLPDGGCGFGTETDFSSHAGRLWT